ncbi:hypothetical protein V6N11_009708 [Hibiscus sabdariffa]|uniref:Uncharacterized protein n=1 Tax=Hibiscus sabdariffa TaxID=183260 RepID=A0ABR2P6M2_9ROSI
MLNSKSQPSVVNDESVSVSKFPLVLVQGDDRLVNASGSGRDLSMGQPSCCHREPADRIGTTSGSSPACVGSSPELVLGQISDPTGPVLTRVQPNEEEGNTRLSPAYSPCFGQDEGRFECSGSKDKNRGVDSALISSQRAGDEFP